MTSGQKLHRGMSSDEGEMQPYSTCFSLKTPGQHRGLDVYLAITPP